MIKNFNMKLNFILLTLFISDSLFAQPENLGPHKAGWTSVTLNRSGRSMNCRVYYPSFVEGNEAQIDTIHAPYNIIGFGHGFAMQTSYYISLFKHLASYGYVVIAPQFPDTQHGELANDFLFCVNYIKQQNNVLGSRFYNLMDSTQSGLFGHSMGGGASLLAASRDSSVKVVAPLAPAETNPSAISAMSLIKGVVYLIAGQSDGITPVNTNQLPMYNNANPIKALPIIKGGNHTKFMDVSIWDWTDPNGNISRTEQLRLTRRYLTSIFKLFLKNDSAFFSISLGKIISSDTNMIFTVKLKPLTPKAFNLIFPKDTLIYSPQTFMWESTYSLNLLDTVRYTLIVSKDSLIRDTFKIAEALLDTSVSFSLGYGKFFWRVKAHTSDSTYTFSNQIFSFDASEPLHISENKEDKFNFVLFQNYPNPFNPVTKIRFNIPLVGSRQAIHVSMKVYDLLGNEVAELVNEDKSPGSYEVTFDAKKLASGVYIYQIKTSEYVRYRKMLLMK